MSESGADAKPRSFIGAVDQGTTSSRFLIFDEEGAVQSLYQLEFSQIHPKSGWLEHDPEEIYESVTYCIWKAAGEFEEKGFSISDIKAVGITNQRETTVVWDATTGKALHNAIVWSDTRTVAIVRELQAQEGASDVYGLCGLPISTYSSAAKLLWLLRNDAQVAKTYDEGNLAFGTIDSWLTFKLNGGTEANKHVSDLTNASRTMFLNLKTLEYESKLFEFFGLDQRKLKLPELVCSSDPSAFGSISDGPLKGIPITSCLGDQSAALVGHARFSPGEAKNTYGTGCFVLCNSGEEPVFSDNGLLATVAYAFKDQKPIYASEGSIAVAGSAVKFLRDNLKVIKESSEIEDLARTVEDNGGVVFVTAFSGLFAPYWIDDAQGTLFGITHHTKLGHIARATLEACCLQTHAVLSSMEKDCGKKLSSLAVDGGLTNSDLCMQIQADLIEIPVERPQMREVTALGAVAAAGLAVGVWKSLDDIKSLVDKHEKHVFKPEASEEWRSQTLSRWNRAVEMSRGWSSEKKD